MVHEEKLIEIIGEEDVKAAFMEILDLCPICNTIENKNRLIHAYNYAYEAHSDMRRKSGELYIFHPIEVAKIVTKDIRLGLTSMIAALLHDVVEDVESISIEDIENNFGKKVAYIVDGLTKVPKVKGKLSTQVATYRKVIMSLSEDVRVVLIKLADRLHNMRTLGEMSAQNKSIKTSETLLVYAPLARKLGLNKIGRELEDLSFKHNAPEEYKKLMKLINDSKSEREAVIQDFKDKVASKLDVLGINYEIKVIRKSLYSTWKLMTEHHWDFKDINNFQTLRLIFQPKEDISERSQCYEIYVEITSLFNPRTGSMRDTVANPRENGFEALTVELMLSDGNWKEIQILSSRMGDIAERGYSSEKKKGNEHELSERDKWLMRIKDQLVNVNQTDEEFFDHFKLTLYTSEIYVYTPEGDMITLPKGASVLDFAFHIHSDIGLHCVGAKVNKTITKRTHKLASGDQVEVISSDTVEPEEEWLQYISSVKAKQIVVTYLKRKKKKQLADGKSIFDVAVVDSKVSLNREFSKKILKHYHCDDIQELYLKLGQKHILPDNLSKVMKSLSSNSIIPNIIERLISNKDTPTNTPQKFNPKQDFVVDDNNFANLCVISQCCLPINGESAIIYKKSDDKMYIHRMECNESMKLRSQYKSLITKVKWGLNASQQFKANLFIEGIDRKSLVMDITKVVSKDMLVNMLSVSFTADNGIYKGKIAVDVPNINVLKTLIGKLKKISGVKSVGRAKI